MDFSWNYGYWSQDIWIIFLLTLNFDANNLFDGQQCFQILKPYLTTNGTHLFNNCICSVSKTTHLLVEKTFWKKRITELVQQIFATEI